jgi:hypothetical protein
MIVKIVVTRAVILVVVIVGGWLEWKRYSRKIGWNGRQSDHSANHGFEKRVNTILIDLEMLRMWKGDD